MTDPIPIESGLRSRFEEAGRRIDWRAAGKSRVRGRTARIAHLHDEEARVERWGTDRRGGVAVDPGPVGALVLLLECLRRGAPTALGAANAGSTGAFPQGRIEARWGPGAVPRDSVPRLADLVEIARYALA